MRRQAAAAASEVRIDLGVGRVIADPSRLRQILPWSRRQRAEVRAEGASELLATSNNGRDVSFAVIDHGPGISKKPTARGCSNSSSSSTSRRRAARA